MSTLLDLEKLNALAAEQLRRQDQILTHLAFTPLESDHLKHYLLDAARDAEFFTKLAYPRDHLVRTVQIGADVYRRALEQYTVAEKATIDAEKLQAMIEHGAAGGARLEALGAAKQ